ncbi:MAG: hypothetical protein CME32_06150 [Gimesia sp.]|uniref:Uncharacterized protein n=2 Tax=Gimesia TaxID=1649453 RepID=A0A6I6AF57_9PLAN|nr:MULTISPECIES: hypothetical protein [Gimesia]KAA0140141.1 hypothetical protein FYZ48_09490 [Gimesia chilikensis]MBN68849.1 hypothetical protein [Gimesia sp.]QDT23051.1 hypothetical protein HG66A1_48640 [Gimesia chilikensis]QGQ25123.1 hypothetical protein F1728_21605 [Gimesia benthica]
MTGERQSIQPPHFVISSEGEILGEDTPENQEMVRRVVACVNACDGITTEELESGIISDMRKVIAQTAPLLQERSQMTELLRREIRAEMNARKNKK